MRLDKFICKSTELTRTDSVALIQIGGVRVNGEIVTNAATQVHENNCVTVEGERISARASRYIMIHKPLDCICSNVDEAYPSVFNYIDVVNASELHVAGRLDADTTGLVLVTDDGRWSFDIIRPTRRCPKQYRVGLRDPVTADLADRFQQGLQLQGEANLTLPAQLEFVSTHEVLLTLTEGRYHQVKRMFAAVGNRVVRLHRQQIGAVRLDLQPGQWRYLSSDEINSF